MNTIIYKNTGLNVINIPDSPQRIPEWGTVVKSTFIDSVQNRNLQGVSVQAEWDTIRDADYIIIDDFCYSIIDITKTSYNVAFLRLASDALTSAGGAGNLNYLDGVTERHHIPKSLDEFGAYDEADPLLTPSHILDLDIGTQKFDSVGTNSNVWKVVESSVDLELLGDPNYVLEAKSYVEPATGEIVTVPSVPYVDTSINPCYFAMGNGVTETVGTYLYDLDDDNVQRGLQLLRDLGIEHSVIAQYSLPKTMFDVTFDSNHPARVWYIADKFTSVASGFGYEYANVRNKRVMYGDNNKVGLLTASGNRIEFNIEEVYSNNQIGPVLIYMADGRSNGKPYFSFNIFHGEKLSGNIEKFFINAVDGMEWRNVPLVYTTKSNSIQDSYHFESSRQIAQNAGAHQQYQTAFEGGRAVARAAEGIWNAGTAAAGNPFEITNRIGVGARDATLAAIDMASLAETAYYQYNTYKLEAAREMFDFGYSQNVVKPEIMFPFQTPSVRDFAGNGVIPYRYKPTALDLNRMDKLLTVYGYRHTTQLESSLFNNRPHFNFVRATGVTVAGNLPGWWKRTISDQLAAGVRVWHVKPDVSYYTQNE